MPDNEPPQSSLILYQTEDGRTRIQCRFENETIWLTQAQLSELFQRERSVITKHIRNIFEEGEMAEGAVCANYAHTAADEKTEGLMASPASLQDNFEQEQTERTESGKRNSLFPLFAPVQKIR